MSQDIQTENNINYLPPESKKKYLPYSVLRLLSGGHVVPKYENKKDVVAIYWNDKYDILHINDFLMVKEVADELWKEQLEVKNLITIYQFPPVFMDIHRAAAEKIADRVDRRYAGKKRAIMIKDQSGCGYWRMVVPARHMDATKFHIDVSQVEVVYDFVLEYDAVFVQRLYDWRQFYVIERLKKAGKKIIYDIDDDIFNIPIHNPAYNVFGPDEKAGARAIMEICDYITTTTEILSDLLGYEDKTVIIPNCIDLESGYVKLCGVDAVDEKLTTISDGHRRIFWQGSATHELDWYECVDAVDRIMKNHEDVRLVILGYMPKIVEKFYSDPTKQWWHGRVEFTGFKNVETYVELTKKIRAEVSIAPLEDTVFNRSKSCIKFLESAAMASPMVCSNCSPYKEVVKNGVNGFLCSTQNEWYEAIEELLEKPKKRLEIIRNARKTVDMEFDIKKRVKDWESLI